MRVLACWMALGLMAGQASGAMAQVRTVDPNTAIDADLAPVPGNGDVSPPPPASTAPAPRSASPSNPPAQGSDPYGTTYAPPANAADPNAGYQKDDVIAGAEGVFGKGAEGLASLIEKILKEQGKPIGYIAGREASGAVIVGLRYGSGTLTHKIEGERKVYWTGPSVGFDVGGNASKVFVLVYNLYDSQKLFGRFPGAEGAAYVIGGFTATYLRKGDVVLIPIRLGVGWRLGVNAGYMKFSEKGRLLPF
ncbi:DUF1134 domain-containing protein [Sphingobium sp.]|uniref:DUF1134 domain-containing protein n=1 Tax=Sphingobium sp. TaxID=1912891 RepID=UPI0039C9116C